MKLWLRIFLLSSLASLAAILIVAAAGLRGGYDAVLGAAVRGLQREAGNDAAVVDREWRTMRSLGLALSGNGRPPLEGASTLPELLRASGAGLFEPGAQIELRDSRGAVLYSSGNLFRRLGESDRPEVAATSGGSAAYVLRRLGGEPVLFLSASESIQGDGIVVSVATSMDSLDAFRKSQITVIAFASLGAALLLLAASFAGSRAIAVRLEELASRSRAVSRGEKGVRANERGRGEIAAVARQFNRMAAEVESTVARLSAEKDDRQRFIESLTHEIRTPATSIVGFADLLRLRAWDERVFSDSLARIAGEGRRLLALMEELKRMLLARTARRELSTFTVRPLLDRVASSAEEMLARRSLSLRIIADPEASISGDPGLLASALLNLVDNAARASPTGSEIELGFAVNGASRTLYVRDLGPGMSDQELARAGEPFHRGKGAGRDGFGLGLAICKEIASHHGAVLRLEPADGGGLRASIVFENLRGIYTPESSP